MGAAVSCSRWIDGAETDDLKPARGIALGLALSTVFWIIAAWAIFG
jgi:hypothetical protein